MLYTLLSAYDWLLVYYETSLDAAVKNQVLL
jgi:hypothetical protein